MSSRCCRTVMDDSVEGVGDDDESGGVGDDGDVAAKLGPGDGSLEEISDGKMGEDDDGDEEDQYRCLGGRDDCSMSSTNGSTSVRSLSE